jgi:hypothetical protein
LFRGIVLHGVHVILALELQVVLNVLGRHTTARIVEATTQPLDEITDLFGEVGFGVHVQFNDSHLDAGRVVDSQKFVITSRRKQARELRVECKLVDALLGDLRYDGISHLGFQQGFPVVVLVPDEDVPVLGTNRHQVVVEPSKAASQTVLRLQVSLKRLEQLEIFDVVEVQPRSHVGHVHQ